MSLSRYALTTKVKNGNGLATSSNMSKIFFACESGMLKHKIYILEEGQRIDQLAGISYQSSSYWWVIAAASGIGWALQVPPGTVLRIPTNLADVLGYIQ